MVMKGSNTMKKDNQQTCETNTNVQVNVDVTKIVKYSCISSVFIVLIIFGSKVLNQIFKNN